MHCSQRIILEILHCLTPADSSLKYFLSKTLFCSQHLLFVYRHISPIENECQAFFRYYLSIAIFPNKSRNAKRQSNCMNQECNNPCDETLHNNRDHCRFRAAHFPLHSSNRSHTWCIKQRKDQEYHCRKRSE